MLTIKLDPRGFLEVTETLMSFTKSKTSVWYYDTKRWLKSSHGKSGDTPDRVMTDSDIQWVKQHYLPRLQAEATV